MISSLVQHQGDQQHDSHLLFMANPGDFCEPALHAAADLLPVCANLAGWLDLRVPFGPLNTLGLCLDCCPALACGIQPGQQKLSAGKH